MAINIIGKKCGNLEVLESIGHFPYKFKNGIQIRQEKFKCLCSCGAICEKWRNPLVSNVTTSCGVKSRNKIDKQIKDHTGKRFGRLVVLNFSHFKRDKGTVQFWNCQCDCGNIKKMNYNSLNRGDSKSCGCLLAETFEYFKSEECIAKRSLPRNQAAINECYARYKESANKRKIDFLISRDFFELKIFENCYYCGSPPMRQIRKKQDVNGVPNVNGVDRKHNNIGYIEENCVTCCKTCNYAKRDLSYEKFEEWIDRLIKFRKSA